MIPSSQGRWFRIACNYKQKQSKSVLWTLLHLNSCQKLTNRITYLYRIKQQTKFLENSRNFKVALKAIDKNLSHAYHMFQNKSDKILNKNPERNVICLLFRIIFVILFMYTYVYLCEFMFVLSMQVLAIARECWISFNWSYLWFLSHQMWAPGTEPKSSARAVSAFKHWAISSPPEKYYLIKMFSIGKVGIQIFFKKKNNNLK